MLNKIITREIDLNGRRLTLETGKLARQADAAVFATLGETVILVTVATRPAAADPGYFPLSVEYVEKYYAGGRITAQKFIKRESRPSEKAILSGRAIDRAIRPLFPKDFRDEVQVIITVLSFDGVNDPAFLGFIGASAALSISSVPFEGPIGVTQIGELGGSAVVNPTLDQLEHLDLLLTVASTAGRIVMIEAGGKQIKDEMVLAGIKQAFEETQPQIGLINELAKEAGKQKLTPTLLQETIDEKLLIEIEQVAREKVTTALFDKDHAWHEATGDLIKGELAARFADRLVSPTHISAIFDKVAKEIMNDTILNKDQRVDGRAMDEVRPIRIETGILPRAHGSAVFERGDTQVLSVATLGPLSAAQVLEGMEGEGQKRFMHHYNMSINPFSVGEVKRLGAPNRRDIGHGDLVGRSVEPVLPSEDQFPYAIRVVSEVLAANASTSQAATCATSLALLNAGVPIEPVAGIAMGLITDHDNSSRFQVITDMQAVEDFYGEMDFKVAGTDSGITGIQMDTKLKGISLEIVEEALKQGKKARELIISKIKEVAPQESEISKYAPKIEVTRILPEEIGLLIGPGGRNINGIIAKTGAQIDIEDDGTVMISSTDEEAIKQALDAVNGMFKKIEPGEIYEGKVVKLAPFGAFVEILPGRDGLVHVSQMASGHVDRPEDVVSEGQTVKVRVLDIDPQGKVSLSMLFGADIKPESKSRSGRSFGGFTTGRERRQFGPVRRGSEDRGGRREFGNRGNRGRGTNRGGRGFGR